MKLVYPSHIREIRKNMGFEGPSQTPVEPIDTASVETNRESPQQTIENIAGSCWEESGI